MDGDRKDRDDPQSSSVYSDAYYRQAPAGRSAYGYRPAQCYAYTGTDGEAPAGRERGRGRVIAVLLLAAVVLASLLLILTRIGGVLWRMDLDPSPSSAERETLYPALTEEADGGFTLSQGSAAALAPLDPRDIYASACPGAVGVTSRGYAYNIFGQLGVYAVTGSGIVLTEDGYILTNFHVIQDAYEMGAPIQILTWEGRSYEAEVVGVESDSDLAVLKAEAAGLVPAALGDSDELTVGQPIYALGNPLGELTFTMTRGIVSALDRRVATEDGAADMFQFDAAVNDGDYGGPVLNDRGQVVGVISARLSGRGAEGLSFAIPVNDACRVAQELIRSGYVPGKAYLGLRLSDVTASVARYYGMERGVYVHSVKPGSCAEAAGIQSGDIITAVGGVEVSSVAELTAVIRGYRAGDSADITVLRDEGYVTVTVTFDEELPAERMTDAEASRREGRLIPSGED